MGIRFYCPNCDHRLNVKAFLAGKRGVCPQCGGGLDIPLESQIVKGAERQSKVVKNANVPASSPAAVAIPPAAIRKLPSSSSPETVLPSPGPFPQPSPQAVPSGRQTGAARSQPHAVAGTGGSAVAPTVPTAAPAVTSRPVRPVRPDPKPALPSASPMQPMIRDPIDEMPESIWYVRPPSGGQYGPARGDVMRKWIGEGRISADSMVWCEGWEDWRSGGEVFPYLRSAGTPAALTPAPVTYAPSTPGPSARGYPNRRRSSLALAITTVVVLGLMSVALLITLILVLNHS